MPRVLVVSDSEALIEEVSSGLTGPDMTIVTAANGPQAMKYVKETLPDLVITDIQVAQMGGIAISLELHLEKSGNRLGHVPVLILLDRRPDVFLVRRSGAEGWLMKPVDPIRIRKAVKALLSGSTYHDETYKPEPVVVSSGSAEKGN